MSSQLREVFGTNVPGWIKKRVKRWKKIFNLNDWVLRVYVSQPDVVQIGDSPVDAHTTTHTPYRWANIHIASHVKDNEEGHAILFHELRHVIYSSHLVEMIERDVINRYVPEQERKHVSKQIDDAVESLIENDVYVFEQLTEL